jgi:HNH endonuclease/Helix-turn-helix domain
MDIEQMAGLYGDGASMSEIARRLGCSKGTVRNHLLKHGVVLRKRGGGDNCINSHGKRWKGGKTTDKQGYVWVNKKLVPEEFHSMAHGDYIAEHRLVMAQYLGRPLTPSEQVHHIDGIRHRNVIDNLQFRVKAHGSGAALRCSDCGSINIVGEEI